MSTTEAERREESASEEAAAIEKASERLVSILNDGSIALLASVGHQTGLFDAMAALPAAGSGHIADAAGLSERYVREWLGGMVTAGFVDYDAANSTYLLRPEYLPLLSGPGTDNIARTLQYIPLMGEVAHKVVGAFKDGGGLSYDDYPRFHHIMAADSAAVNDASLLDTIVPLSDCDDALRAGIAVADIGCGEGHALNLMAGAFPASQFTGYDFSADALDVAIAEAAELGLSNGDGLGTVWGRQLAERMLRDAGFSRIEVKDLEDDPFNAYYVARRE